MKTLEKINTLRNACYRQETVAVMFRGAKAPVYGRLDADAKNAGYTFCGVGGLRQHINPVYSGLSIKNDRTATGSNLVIKY